MKVIGPCGVRAPKMAEISFVINMHIERSGVLGYQSISQNNICKNTSKNLLLWVNAITVPKSSSQGCWSLTKFLFNLKKKLCPHIYHLISINKKTIIKE